MEKMLLVSDTHVGIHKAADLWHDVTVNLFKEIADVCKRNNIKTIIHLGDFTDNRRHINVKSLNVCIDIAELLRGLDVYLIVGNHDTFYRDHIEPTSLTMFNEYNHMHVVDEPLSLGEAMLAPWNYDVSKLPKTKYLFGHFEINGFPVSDGFEYFGSNLKLEDFNRFDHVYSGHFHIPSERGNITYLGSAIQMNFGDSGSSRGYYILEDDMLQFIQYKDAPEYIIQRTDERIDKEKIKNNIVKLIYTKDYGVNVNNRLLEEVQSLKPMLLFTDFGRITTSSVDGDISQDDSVLQLKNNRDILFEYLEKMVVPDYISKDTLKGMLENLTREL